MSLDEKNMTSKEIDEYYENWKKRYDALSDTTKKHLAHSGVMIHSLEQAERIMQISEAFDTMFRIMEK